MEAAEQAEGAGNPALSRPKRSRAGCLTCRTRRRKCAHAFSSALELSNVEQGDEGKPKCQNCISKGFECRYAAAFQILGKNNFTPGVSTSVKYSNLRVGDRKFHDLTALVTSILGPKSSCRVRSEY